MTPAQKRYYEKNRAKVIAAATQWNRENPERRKVAKTRHRLKAQYRLTPEQYNQLLAAQQGRCGNPGCDQTPGSGAFWHLDHNHETGTVRGFLCGGCNMSLGILKENPERIRGLIQYLQNPPISFLLGG